jgi:hypothetical protein
VVVVLAFLAAMINLTVAAVVASNEHPGPFLDLWTLIKAAPVTAAAFMCAFFVACAAVSLLFNALLSYEPSTRRLSWCVSRSVLTPS